MTAPSILYSVAFMSSGINSGGFFQFNDAAGQPSIYIGPGNPQWAQPGAGAWPNNGASDYYLRGIGLTLFSNNPADYALIGHSSSIGAGDWLTTAVPANREVMIMFPDDCCPYFTSATDYLDCHTNSTTAGAYVSLVVFLEPVVTP